MFEYMTRHMVARQPITYAGQELVPGDLFYATPDDAGYFQRHGRADPAPAPAAKPAATPAPVVQMPAAIAAPVPAPGVLESSAASATVGEMSAAAFAGQTLPGSETATVELQPDQPNQPAAAAAVAAAAGADAQAPSPGPAVTRGRGRRVAPATDAS